MVELVWTSIPDLGIKLKLPADSEIETNDIQEWALIKSKSGGFALAIRSFIPEGSFFSVDELKRVIAAGPEFARFIFEEAAGSEWRVDYETKDGLLATSLRHMMLDCGAFKVTPEARDLVVTAIMSIEYA